MGVARGDREPADLLAAIPNTLELVVALECADALEYVELLRSCAVFFGKRLPRADEFRCPSMWCAGGGFPWMLSAAPRA